MVRTTGLTFAQNYHPRYAGDNAKKEKDPKHMLCFESSVTIFGLLPCLTTELELVAGRDVEVLVGASAFLGVEQTHVKS